MRVSLSLLLGSMLGYLDIILAIDIFYLEFQSNYIFSSTECPEESPLMDGQRQHKNTPNGAANTCEVSPLLPDEGMSQY